MNAVENIRSSHLVPISMTIADAVRWSGISRTELYRLIGLGKIRAIKNGKRTLVLTETLREHVSALPAASIAPARKKATLEPMR